MKREIITIENGIVFMPFSREIWMSQYEIARLFYYFMDKVNSNIRSMLKSKVFDEKIIYRTYYSKSFGNG